jgi:cytosine/adenosine deaminase-related metal-dependent hydrolase
VNIHAAPWVVPIATPPIADGAVALDDHGRVIAIGRTSDLAHLGATVMHDGVLMPGLVNAHAHLELSHLRGHVPGGGGLVQWISALLAARPHADADEARLAAQAAAQTMIARGTVAVADVTNDGMTARLLAEAGLEALVLHERIAPRGEPAAARIPGTVPTAHATYSCSAEALRRLARDNGGQLASIHVEEDPAEALWLLDESGPFAEFLASRDALPTGARPRLRPVEWLDSLGVIGRGTLLVHMTVADTTALEIAAERGAIAVLCPRSNLHIGGRLPPVEGVRAVGLRAALGTDSLASSPSLDVLGEVQALARAGADPNWTLRAATLGGAEALGRRHLGALSVGKRPGLVAFGDDARSLRDPVAWLAHEGADAPATRLA